MVFKKIATHDLWARCRWMTAAVVISLLVGCAGLPPPPPPTSEPEPTRTDLPASELTVIQAPEDVETRRLALANGPQAIDPEAVGYFMDVFRARVQRDLADTGIDIEPGETSILVTFPNQIGFEFGSADLTPGAARLIEYLADILREYRATLIVISGHTDDVGDPDVNLKLSQARARSVAEHLAGLGVAYRRLMIKGFGSTQPVADNSTEAGRASNRRVELILRLIVRQAEPGLAATELS